MPNRLFSSIPAAHRTVVSLSAIAVVCSLASGIAPAAEPLPLTGTYWRLASLDGAPVNLADEASLPHIALHAETERVAGFGGCNRFFGRYAVTENALSIQPLGGSRAACPGIDALEQAFLRALAAIDHYSISGGQLTLGVADRVSLVFEAVTERTTAGSAQ